MKQITLGILFCILSVALPNAAYTQDAITNNDISEITQRLQEYSNDQLLERRDFIIQALQEDSGSDSAPTSDESRASMLLELSIIEQLLIVAGIVILDNVTEDTSTPPDTVFPVITINGSNPATVELGSTYTDAGATSDGGETVTTSGTVDSLSLIHI